MAREIKSRDEHNSLATLLNLKPENIFEEGHFLGSKYRVALGYFYFKTIIYLWPKVVARVMITVIWPHSQLYFRATKFDLDFPENDYEK